MQSYIKQFAYTNLKNSASSIPLPLGTHTANVRAQFLLWTRAVLGLPVEHRLSSLPVFALTFSV